MLFGLFSFICAGLLAVIRLSEPYVWSHTKVYFKCFKNQKTSDYSAESLDSFIQSACNAEYVSFVLAAIISSTLSGSKNVFKLESYFVKNKDDLDVSSHKSIERLTSIQANSE